MTFYKRLLSNWIFSPPSYERMLNAANIHKRGMKARFFSYISLFPKNNTEEIKYVFACPPLYCYTETKLIIFMQHFKENVILDKRKVYFCLCEKRMSFKNLALKIALCHVK